MNEIRYRLSIHGQSAGANAASARKLADCLNNFSEIKAIEREKIDESTMDLGSIIQVVVTSGAALSLAQGISYWLRTQRDASIDIEIYDNGDKNNNLSIKAKLEHLTPDVAHRITKEILNQDRKKHE